MRRAKAQAGAAWAAAGLPGRVVSTSQSESGSNYTSTGSCGDGEGGGPWRRGGAAATGRAADLGCDGARRRRGGRRRLKGGEVTAGQNNALSARWHECAGTSARARTAHGEGSELGRRGPANLREAGGGGTLAARMELSTLVARCYGEVGRCRQRRRRGRRKLW